MIFPAVFSILLTLSNVSLSDLLSPAKAELIIQGQRKILNCRWQEAHEFFDDLQRLTPDDPAGCLFRAAALQAEMIDREENLYGAEMFLLCDSVVYLSEERLKHCTARDSAICYLYLGHQDAQRALWEKRFGSSLSAFSFAVKSRNAYQKGVEVDSSLYDLYLGLGLYHYWKSVKSGLLKLTGIFKDERAKGMREVSLAADSSLYFKEAARSALIWIMINEEHYDSAIALSRAMLAEYPDGNSFLWPLGEALYENREYNESIIIYEKLLNRLKGEPGNYYNVIECVYRLYQAYRKMGEGDKLSPEIEYLSAVSYTHLTLPTN